MKSYDPSNPRRSGKPAGVYGKPEGSGRAKGTKNLKTLAREAEIRSLALELKAKKFDVVKELLNLYKDGDTTTDQKITLLTMIMDRISPKLAPMKVEPKIETMDSDLIIEAVKDATDEQLMKSVEEAEK